MKSGRALARSWPQRSETRRPVKRPRSCSPARRAARLSGIDTDRFRRSRTAHQLDKLAVTGSRHRVLEENRSVSLSRCRKRQQNVQYVSARVYIGSWRQDAAEGRRCARRHERPPSSIPHQRGPTARLPCGGVGGASLYSLAKRPGYTPETLDSYSGEKVDHAITHCRSRHPQKRSIRIRRSVEGEREPI